MHIIFSYHPVQSLCHYVDTEHGHFRVDFFPPIEMPTIPHKPWAECNIPMLLGVYNEVCHLIKKIDTGVHKTLNSSYHSKWFCIVKKDSKLLCSA